MDWSGLTASQRIDTWIPVGFFVLLWAWMQWNKKLPPTDSIQKFVAIINSRGGNIVILTVASVYFFRYSMYLFMHLLEMVQAKTITEDNAFGLMAIQFVTTSAFGGAMGALLKTMTGESSTARATDSPGGNGNGKSLVITPGIPSISLRDTKDPKPPTAENSAPESAAIESSPIVQSPPQPEQPKNQWP
jgi:hypothetical protein